MWECCGERFLSYFRVDDPGTGSCSRSTPPYSLLPSFPELRESKVSPLGRGVALGREEEDVKLEDPVLNLVRRLSLVCSS